MYFTKQMKKKHKKGGGGAISGEARTPTPVLFSPPSPLREPLTPQPSIHGVRRRWRPATGLHGYTSSCWSPGSCGPHGERERKPHRSKRRRGATDAIAPPPVATQQRLGFTPADGQRTQPRPWRRGGWVATISSSPKP